MKLDAERRRHGHQHRCARLIVRRHDQLIVIPVISRLILAADPSRCGTDNRVDACAAGFPARVEHRFDRGTGYGRDADVEASTLDQAVGLRELAVRVAPDPVGRLGGRRLESVERDDRLATNHRLGIADVPDRVAVAVEDEVGVWICGTWIAAVEDPVLILIP